MNTSRQTNRPRFAARFGIRFLLFLTLVIAIPFAGLRYWKYQRRINEIEAELERFNALKDPRIASRVAARGAVQSTFYRQIFLIADDDLLPWLINHDDDSVAIQAAWEAVERTIPEEYGDEAFRPDSSAVLSFLKVVEHRTESDIPVWWREVVVDSCATKRHSFYSGDPTTVPYHETGFKRICCPTKATITVSNEGLSYRCNDKQATIPKQYVTFSNQGAPLQHVSGCFRDGHFYFALHENVGQPHSVGCIDLKTNQVKWDAEACGSDFSLSLFGAGRHESWVEVVANDTGEVYVFGAAAQGFYLHGFDTGTGETVGHFSTEY